MDGKAKTINAACSLFACKECRTKTGYAHQRWCSAAGKTKPVCTDCAYWLEQDKSCGHPQTKQGEALNERR